MKSNDSWIYYKNMIKPGEKSKFFFRNLFKGLAWFAFLILIFILARTYVDPDYEKMLEPIFSNTFLIFTIYCLSELVIGLIPPELFIIWALRAGNFTDFVLLVIAFAVLSFIAGILAYLFGKYLSSTVLFRYMRKRYLGKYQHLFQRYGAFLILVAALTPVPYSAISMLVGSFQYPAKKYLFWALSRFAKFAFYGAIIWEANLV
jgi:membrane protein DedA with SNARE-associated domain